MAASLSLSTFITFGTATVGRLEQIASATGRAFVRVGGVSGGSARIIYHALRRFIFCVMVKSPFEYVSVHIIKAPTAWQISPDCSCGNIGRKRVIAVYRIFCEIVAVPSMGLHKWPRQLRTRDQTRTVRECRSGTGSARKLPLSFRRQIEFESIPCMCSQFAEEGRGHNRIICDGAAFPWPNSTSTANIVP